MEPLIILSELHIGINRKGADTNIFVISLVRIKSEGLH